MELLAPVLRDHAYPSHAGAAAALDSFEPKLSILPAAQRRLWPELAAVSRPFVLYGGTGLALRFGHRQSVDFDFFSTDRLDHAALNRLEFLRGSEVLQQEENTLTVSVDRGGPVKLSFFGTIDFGRAGTPQRTSDGVATVASVLDLGATKVKVMLQRVEAKDYSDIAALLRSGLPLEQILGAARTLFGASFNPIIAQKTLCWFEGGDLSTLSIADRELLSREATRDMAAGPLPKLSNRVDDQS